MDKKKIKRIIAREGIIFLGIIIPGFIILGLAILLNADTLVVCGAFITYLGYPLCMLIRFIGWVVRTLRRDE